MADELTNLGIRVLTVAIVIAGTWLTIRGYRSGVRRLGRTMHPRLVGLVQQFGSWAIWTVVVIILLSYLAVNIEILLLVIGLGSLAMLLAYQDVLTDAAASQFISIYQPFKVGEWIETKDHYGRVIEMDLIHTKLVTPDNEIVVIPNSNLLKQSIVNRTRSGGLRIQVPVTVKNGTDLSKLEEHLVEIGKDMKFDLVQDTTPQVRVMDVGQSESHLVLLLEIANPGKRDLIISNVQRRVYELLRDSPGLK